MARRHHRELELRPDEAGASAPEYVLAVVLVSFAALGAWRALGDSVETQVACIAGSIDGSGAPCVAGASGHSVGASREALGEAGAGSGSGAGAGAGAEAGAPRAGAGPMTEEEARVASTGVGDLIADNGFVRSDLYLAGLLPDQDRVSDGDIAAVSADVEAILTNPVFALPLSRGGASYLGYVWGQWVLVDVDDEGRVSMVDVLDGYNTAVWLCEAGSAEACALRDAMDQKSRDEMRDLSTMTIVVLGLLPIVGSGVDAVDWLATCPASPVSVSCGLSTLAFVPGVPGLGRADDVASTAVRRAQDGAQVLRRGEALVVARPAVRIIGAFDAAHEQDQARRLAELLGGGEVTAFGNASRGVEGVVRRAGSTSEIAFSLKDFSNTPRMSNVLREIRRNSNQILGTPYRDVVLHAKLSDDFTAAEVSDFVMNGPLRWMPDEGVLQMIVFETSDGYVLVGRGGVVSTFTGPNAWVLAQEAASQGAQTASSASNAGTSVE